MGYGGIDNSVAIEFDTWYNPEHCDMFYDHVSIQTNGREKGNGPGCSAAVSQARRTNLADGVIHKAKVTYYPLLLRGAAAALVSNFQGTRNLPPFLLDGEDNQRPGLLAVWVDDMTHTNPLIALPINLAVALKLRGGRAYVGFTSATGRNFQKHDIISWKFSEVPEGPHDNTQPLDYHTSDQLHDATHVHPPRVAPDVQQTGVNGDRWGDVDH